MNYYLNSAGVPWTEEALRLASGFGTFGQVTTQGTAWAARIDPVPNRPGFPSTLFYTDVGEYRRDRGD